MSIDDRLRTGLAANTAALTPALADELDALGHRVRRRRQTRIAVYALAAASVVVAVVLWAPGTVEGLREGTLPGDRTSVPSPTPLSDLTDGSAVAAGRYALEFPGSSRSGELPLAVITVPEGYFAGGASGVFVGGADSPFRHLDLWRVAKVVADPCSGPVYTDPGPTVQDLADALAALPVWESTRPKPVTVGGYDGLVMDFDVPDPTPDGCGAGPYHWIDDLGGSQGLGPGKRQRLWILDVAGERVMIMAGWFPVGVSDPSAGVTPAQAQELIGMAESITFLSPPAASP